MIEGVRIVELQKSGGTFSMLRSSDKHFLAFGEIYFSSVHPGAIKGWHRHTPATLNYTVVQGTIKMVLYDARDSPTKGEIMEITLEAKNPCLVQIPSMVWNGFTAVGKTAIVANCCTHAHGDFTSERLDPMKNDIPYKWEI